MIFLNVGSLILVALPSNAATEYNADLNTQLNGLTKGMFRDTLGEGGKEQEALIKYA